ncbi:MAG: sigma-70 family RNA polymerase sigma factor [Planctomycetes bacterium]|nr:sigma-70 family RNA polymerase sigma factor [Planctomycetota bacterium]
MTTEPSRTLDTLLAQSDWVTALARALVRDPATADDAVQATWLDVLAHPPSTLQSPRSFLATLLRRKLQRLRRTDQRRTRHETAAATPPEPAPSPAALTERLHTHRELVDAVLALDEPYRATVVLRFFEHLEVEGIAQRTGSPVNTVRSRLQRALQQLRERLDRDRGGRERWLPAVLVLAQRPLPNTAAATGTTAATVGIAGSLAMKKLLALAAVAVFGLGLWISWPPADAGLVARQSLSTAAATTGSLPSGAERSPTGVADGPPLRTAAIDGGAALTRPPRVVADRQGKPLAGVVMRATSATTVRWQGGDRGWISGPEGSRRIDAAEEQRLRDDPGYAAQWFAQFTAADEWRAEILGTPLPARETISGDDGSFRFAPPLQPDDAAIAVGDPRYVLLQAGRSDGAPWRVGPAARVEGTVRDLDGKPIADAFVLAICPDDGGSPLPGAIEVRSDDHGRYLVRRALAGGLLQARADGYARAFQGVGMAPNQQLDLVLLRRPERDRKQILGTVVDRSGRPIPDANVWFGRQSTRTANDGRFEVTADEAEPQYAMTIVKPGFAPLQRDHFGAIATAADAGTQDLLFVLEANAAPLRGLVLGSDGAPLPGALVGLLDPTLLDITFTPVEGHGGGWNRGVQAGADGSFTLTGLAERPYRVVAIDPRNGARAVSAPHAPGSGDLVLRLPADLRTAVTGTVLQSGAPAADASVEVGYVTHVTKGGGTMMESTAAVPCAADGTFTLAAVPRRGAWLQVRIGGALRQLLPVEALGDAALRIELDDDGPRWLQLIGSARSQPATIHFELADGALQPARTADGPAWLGVDGDAPVLALPAGAVAVVVAHGSSGAKRLELTDDRAVHLRVPQ